ncbi:MCE family protein [Mycobacterium sp. URHB0044]|uniref:MCE family protein n=1 Tax=Mycobacterium sp. URHB0044 TaxID=1380386 RepID=UPI0009DEE72E|nr:MCE family protein [Mycobacterium sp. URHB0044]
MKSFSERNPFVIGAIGAALTLGLVLLALNYQKIPGFDQTTQYEAYFAEAGGLTPSAAVQVSGFKVGSVDSISLDGPRVLIKFSVIKDIRIGDRTEAAIKTKSLLGSKILEVTPRGDGELSQPIALDRTQSPYQLPDALGDLTGAISGLDTDQLSTSLDVLSETFADTPPALKAAVEGIGRFSETLDKRDGELRKLLQNANKVTGVLSERSDQVLRLVQDTNALLAQLQSQSAALDQISGSISAVTQQIKGFIGENRDSLKPAVDKLNGVLAIVNGHKEQLQKAIKGLINYATGLGESVGSGPFFKAYISNLFPGQFVQPFIDAAFKDLGLDPTVLLPSQRSDPQVGQPGTPGLPMPYPRTGQGGEPRMTLPDAITGNPEDQHCGPPGIALPGPGCYPYREPLPAPAPGGPPPGPPALEVPPNDPSTTGAPSNQINLPAPGQPLTGPQLNPNGADVTAPAPNEAQPAPEGGQ